MLILVPEELVDLICICILVFVELQIHQLSRSHFTFAEDASWDQDVIVGFVSEASGGHLLLGVLSQKEAVEVVLVLPVLAFREVGLRVDIDDLGL